MLSLQFENFADHAANTVRNLINSSNFCDVTLSCDGGQRIDCHRFLLSSASPMLDKIMSESSLFPQTIFLRGVQFEDLYGIIKFIYLGEVQILSENLDRFFLTARDLEIQELLKEKYSNICKTPSIPRLMPKPLSHLKSYEFKSNFLKTAPIFKTEMDVDDTPYLTNKVDNFTEESRGLSEYISFRNNLLETQTGNPDPYPLSKQKSKDFC